MVQQLLEEQICQMYDNIHSQFQLTDLARQAFNRVQQLEQEAADNERKARLRRDRLLQKQQEQYDSALCPTVPAAAMIEQANLFLQQQQAKAETPVQGNLSSNFLGRLLG
jgi:Asp-tRNA(Asn)/Glu-tRNA(Gln) amidotransferase A subunit family amidase